MGTLFLDQLKRQASSFLHERIKTARLVLTDVTQAELMAEEATNDDPCSPDAKTMTRIAEASFDIDNYWRIVDVLHRRLYKIDWKQWRQSYKSLGLLDFLLTHGPQDFSEEFQCDTDVIEELGTFKFIDEKGFDWGANMQKRSERILELLQGGEALKQARLKALKITKEIQGFGNPMFSPPFSPSSSTSQASTLGSFSTSSSPWSVESSPPTKEAGGNFSGGIRSLEKLPKTSAYTKENDEGLHLWDFPPIEETDNLLHDPEVEKRRGLINGICSKIVGSNPSKCDGKKVALRSFCEVGKLVRLFVPAYHVRPQHERHMFVYVVKGDMLTTCKSHVG
ncbi:uncharacterized protein LOC132296486 [Cornus florida]|uniref:uncharacterized protein LOC132296486 n=1 Tax=Cornus florida TaxID=4283 RepID=UPI0028A07CAC|nr:uncharacterized protein LOC132296486 [Cornus florida]